MLELIPCASSAVGGGHDESIYDTFMSHLPAVLTAYTQAVYTPSKTGHSVQKAKGSFMSWQFCLVYGPYSYGHAPEVG